MVVSTLEPDQELDYSTLDLSNPCSNSKFRTILRHFSDQSKY